MEALDTRRRRRVRAPFGGMGAMDRSRAEGFTSGADEDEDDLGPVDLNARVAQMTDTPPAVIKKSFSPKSVLGDVRKRATEYEREARMRMLHKFLVRNTPLNVIADELNISVATVMRDRDELYKQLRKEALNLDLGTLIGDSVAFYREVQALAMRQASLSNLPANLRLASLRTALSARNDSAKFLHVAGVFDILQYTPEDQKDSSDLEKLAALAEKLMADDDEMSFMAEEAGTTLAELNAGLVDEIEEENNVILL